MPFFCINFPYSSPTKKRDGGLEVPKELTDFNQNDHNFTEPYIPHADLAPFTAITEISHVVNTCQAMT